MDAQVIRRGAIAGAVGGMAMAMWSMVMLAVAGDGFWQPVNLIAHVFWSGAPLDGSLDVGALALGLMVHMVVSMMLGVAIAVVAARLGGDVAATAGVAMVVGVGAWAAGAVAWNAVDQVSFDAFTPWVLATGHLMFAMGTAGVLVAFAADREHEAAVA